MVKSIIKLWVLAVMAMCPFAGSQPITVPGSAFPIVQTASNWFRFLAVDTNGQRTANSLTRSNLTFQYVDLRNQLASDIGGNSTNFTTAISNLLANLSGGFHILITNGSTTAQIQSVLNGNTNGVIEFQPGPPYAITTNIILTNFSGVILGNGSTVTNASNVPGFLFDTTTNYHKTLVIDNLVFEGGIPEQYNTTNYFTVFNGVYAPYYNAFWTNRSGLRVETSGGVRIQNCTFKNWSGNGCLALQAGGTFNAQNMPKFEFLFNRCFTNFIGVYATGDQIETPGYYNADSSLWFQASAEYCLIEGNDCFNNQVGIAATAGNALVQGNTINGNWIGLSCYSGANSGHGRYCGNTINHNFFALYGEACQGGLFQDNQMLADAFIVFNNVTDVTLKNNSFGQTGLILTNGTTGNIVNNVYLSGTIWGTGPGLTGFYTNITPNILIAGNFTSDRSNTDGTVPSLTMQASAYSDNTNYVAARFAPPITSGTFKLVPSNGWVWSVSSNSTNRLFQVSQ